MGEEEEKIGGMYNSLVIFYCNREQSCVAAFEGDLARNVVYVYN